MRLAPLVMGALAFVTLAVDGGTATASTPAAGPATATSTTADVVAATTAPGVGAAAASTPPTVTAGDAGTLSSTLVPDAVLFPTGTEPSLRALIRDCGLSSALPNGASLWVFCDTAAFDNVTGAGSDKTARLRFVPSGTAALAATTPDPTPRAPVDLHEAAYPSMATPFITSSSQFGPADDRRPIACSSGAPAFAWTTGMVTLPGTHTVVSFFQDHCVDSPTSYPGYDVGVAEFTAPTNAADDFSGADQLRVSSRYDSVLVNPAPGIGSKWGYGAGTVVAGDYLYLYSASAPEIDCTTGDCHLMAPGFVHVARVRWTNGEYRSGANYEYYTGSAAPGWSRDPSAAVDVIPDQLWPSGDGISVAWYPQLQRYVMSYANSVFAPTDGAFLRTSTTPWGPWSSPINSLIDASSSLANPSGGCNAPTTCRTFLLHPDLTGVAGTKLYFSYVRNNDLADATGQIVTFNGGASMQVRLASLDLQSLPAPPPETELVDTPTDPSASDAQTFSFTTATRATTLGDEPPPAGFTTAADQLTYRCALDGAAPQPCRSPLSLATVAPGPHTFTVQATTSGGLTDPTPATWTWSVDRDVPETSIESGPTSTSDPSGSRFTFSGADDQTPADRLRYECARNNDQFVPCEVNTTFLEAQTGPQSLLVRAVDLAGNVDPTPAAWAWSVDMDPMVTFTSTPPAFTEAADARFAFTVGDDLTPTESLVITCSFDGALVTPCDSAWMITGVPTGAHAFTVDAVDGNRNVGSATWRWTIDTVAPTAFASTTAAPLTNLTSATVVFGGIDDLSAPDALTFECRADGATAAPCTSPFELTSLGVGSHEVAVRAIDQTGHPSAVASVTWWVDTAIPSVSFAPTPPSVTTTDHATFAFAGSDDRTPGDELTFECSLDQRTFGACASGVQADALVPGAHTFAVRAVDGAGNRSAPLTHAWIVDIAAVTGVVRDQVSGAGIPGVRVQVFHATGIIVATTTTAADGSYRIGYQPSGSYRLSFYDPTLGHVMQYSVGMPTLATATAIPVTLGSTATLDAVLEPLSTIGGTVTDRANGRPVSRLWVTLFDDAGSPVALASTASDGTYRFAQLRTAGYRVGVSDPSGVYVPSYWSAAVPASSLAGATTIAAHGGLVNASLTVEPLTTIAGVVTDHATGAAVPNIWVTLLDANGAKLGLALTGADGGYRFPSVRLGSYVMSFGDVSGTYVPGYWRASDPTVTSSLVAATRIATAGGTFTASAALSSYSTITGTLTDERTGKPVVGVYLVLTAADRPGILAYTFTAADGTFSIPRVAPGEYKLLVLDLAQLKGSPSHWISEWYDTGDVSLDGFWTATVIRADGTGPIPLRPVSLGHT
jgi:hypothetical protein